MYDLPLAQSVEHIKHPRLSKWTISAADDQLSKVYPVFCKRQPCSCSCSSPIFHPGVILLYEAKWYDTISPIYLQSASADAGTLRRIDKKTLSNRACHSPAVIWNWENRWRSRTAWNPTGSSGVRPAALLHHFFFTSITTFGSLASCHQHRCGCANSRPPVSSPLGRCQMD